jgi:hypothetical protein
VRGVCVDGAVLHHPGRQCRDSGGGVTAGGRLAADIVVSGWVVGKKRKRIGET